MRRRKSWFSKQKIATLVLLTLLVGGVLIATIYVVQRASVTDRKILQLNFIAILLGLVYEYKRISEKWSTVLLTAAAAYVFSFFAFTKGKGNYVFEDHLEMWPYFFLFLFIMIATVVQFTTVTRKLTEGITLLLTIAINYWIITNNFWDKGVFIKALIVLNILFSLFSIFNALSYKTLSKTSRLTLSIWSSIITIILAADNFYHIYQYRDIEHLPTFGEGLFIFFQYFLLGVSSMYIAQNLIMVGAYLPGKRYKETVREMNEAHLKRFSDEQVYVLDSIIVLFISGAGFTLNFFYAFLPPNFMIWAMVALTPVLLYLTHRLVR